MKNELLNTSIDNIRNKLGEENSAIISDEIANLINLNNIENTEIETNEKNYNELQEKYNKVLETNSKLMQQVTMGLEKEEKEEKEKPFSFKEMFDKNGHFINE